MTPDDLAAMRRMLNLLERDAMEVYRVAAHHDNDARAVDVQSYCGKVAELIRDAIDALESK